MSRVGKTILKVPSGVQVMHQTGFVSVSKGNTTLTQEIKGGITVEVNGDELKVLRPNDTREAKAFHGLYNRLIANMIKGVNEGFKRILILNGVGYRATMKGQDLSLAIGYSHPIEVKAELGLTFKILSPAEMLAAGLPKDGAPVAIEVSGASKEKVGAMASKIRDLRPVEPYHMYGVRYSDERVRRKESKSGAKGKK
ncbi:MAG: 50S ribosomal protein L6 [Christensenellaceae bacterium]|jgi:large subunit ribosomal protein L6|nr:50S ribosomal protein L6 [Christensenellaceae bacterium]